LSNELKALSEKVGKMADGIPKNRLLYSLKALGTSGDNKNGVKIDFGKCDGDGAACTELVPTQTSYYLKVRFDPGKTRDGLWGINGAHEGNVVHDYLDQR
jgi:hypothetical protein